MEKVSFLSLKKKNIWKLNALKMLEAHRTDLAKTGIV